MPLYVGYSEGKTEFPSPYWKQYVRYHVNRSRQVISLFQAEKLVVVAYSIANDDEIQQKPRTNEPFLL